MSRYMDEQQVIETKKRTTEIVHPEEIRTLITNKTDMLIFNALKENQPATRMQLCDKTGIARTTIYDNLVKLQKRKLIEKFSRTDGKRGRPLVFWKLKNQND